MTSIDFDDPHEMFKRYPTGGGSDFEIMRAYADMVLATGFAAHWVRTIRADPSHIKEAIAPLVAWHTEAVEPYVRVLTNRGYLRPAATRLLAAIFQDRCQKFYPQRPAEQSPGERAVQGQSLHIASQADSAYPHP